MAGKMYRFDFSPIIPIEEPEMSLHLAIYAVEGLFGEACVACDVRYNAVEDGRVLLVDASTPAGWAVVRVFTALAVREFGREAVTITRASKPYRRSASPTGRG